MKIAIVSNIANGIGLQKDYELLRSFLVRHGHEVTGIPYLMVNPPTGFDIAIFLETVPSDKMKLAKRNWAMPNPEWLQPEYERNITRHCEKVLCKTHEAYNNLSKKFYGVSYVGFLTEDRLDASVARKRQFLHVGGNGGHRGTAQVLEAWRSCRYYEGVPAEDAPLVIVSNSVAYQHEDTPSVTFIKRATDEELRRLQNESLYHIYPSQTEGFGHAIHEALSVGAMLFTTDAPPMNETKISFKIPTSGCSDYLSAKLYEVNPADVRSRVNEVLNILPPDTAVFRKLARKEFEDGNAEFERLFLPHLASEHKAVVCIHGNHGVSFCTEQDLAWTFGDMGHRVVCTQENETATEEILERCTDNSVNLFVYVHTHGWITPGKMDMGQLIQKLQAKGIKTASFHLDRYRGLNLGDGRESRVGTHPFWHTQTVFTADGGNEDWFKALGVNHKWLPPGVVKKWCVKGTPKDDLKIDVGFVGARGYHPEYPFREQLIQFLEKTYGHRFRLFSGFREQSLNDLYASIRVVVGDSCFGGADRYWSDRVPETIGRGGFLIHPASEGLRIPGLVTYEPGNLGDLADKIDYYLLHEDERLKLRDCAQAWVGEHDTYTNRAQAILRAAGL